MLITHIKKWIRGEHTFSDVIDFFRGNLRYWFYYHAHWMLRHHIAEQIEYRIQVMKAECYASGSCVICGCKTTNLQMANKACEGNCYPPMMNKRVWEEFKINEDEL